MAHKYILKIKDCHGVEDIFSKSDFQKFVHKRELTEAEKNKKNSEIAATIGKELVARQFLEEVKKYPSTIKLDSVGIDKIKNIFDWLYKEFQIK